MRSQNRNTHNEPQPWPERSSHLGWAIEHRAKNQKSALRLLRLLKTNEEKIKRHKYDPFAQDLVGIAFSLWRAAFLANKEGSAEQSFESSMSFLETVISDNTIGFPQDKKEKDWTFNFYTDNVRFAFQALKKLQRLGHLVPEWKVKARTPQERWEYGQSRLDETIDNLETELNSLP